MRLLFIRVFKRTMQQAAEADTSHTFLAPYRHLIKYVKIAFHPSRAA
jgi:hypothetical protein